MMYKKRNIMKKIMLIILLVVVLSLITTSFTYDTTGSPYMDKVRVDVQEKVIHCHTYVIATSAYNKSCGVAMVHSEACRCKKTR